MREEQKLLSDGVTPARSAREGVAVTRGPENHLVNIRDMIIEASGITPEELGHTLRGAYDKLTAAMSAVKIEPHTYQGAVIEKTEHTDWHVILKAIQTFADLFGVTATKSNTARPITQTTQSITVSVNLGEGNDPLTIETSARVVEGEDITSRESSARYSE